MRQPSFSVVGVVCLMLAAAWLAAGCGREEARGRPKLPLPKKKQAQEMPEIPGDDDEKSGEADVLVKSTDVLTRYAKPLYEQDPTVPAGALSGLCSIPLEGRITLPTAQPVNLEKGADAIRKPMPGEVAYYRKAPLRTPAYITYNRRTRRYGVGGAVLVIRGIKKGQRPPLIRTSFDLHARLILNYNVRKNPWDTPTVRFCMVKDRVVFRTYDPFPSHFVFKNMATGEIVLDKVAAGFTGGMRHETFTMNAEYTFGHGVVPPHTQSPPLKQFGAIYEMTCRRHPWQRGWCFVVDNPYVAVSKNGLFNIKGIPVGIWTVEVWHPELEPVEAQLEVTIEEDETAELGVLFKIPPALQAAKRP